jgi:hypothetical protein
LIQGVTQASSIVVAHEPQCHTAGALEIYIEYTAEMGRALNPKLYDKMREILRTAWDELKEGKG